MATTITTRTQHTCSAGCACRSWQCYDCGTPDLVDRRARYETEPEGPDRYAPELCTVCGAPLCDSCVLAGGHECPPPAWPSPRPPNPSLGEPDELGRPRDHRRGQPGRR
jgi:hypothetical protein